jgi:AcrR family transcriptional regulator
MDTRDKLIEAIRAAARKAGTKKVTLAEFMRLARCGDRAVYQHFASWMEACAAAGVAPGKLKPRLTQDEIFEAMLEAFAAQGGVTTIGEFKTHFRYSTDALRDRRMNWLKALVACRDWAAVHAPAHPMLPALERRIAAKMPVKPHAEPPPRQAPRDVVPRWQPAEGRTMGEVINFRGMLHAPANEHEVVALFAILARDLDFLIETIGTGFPDCEAKRRVGARGEWQRVRIEFEQPARNFQRHRHDPKKCDLIVCWRNNWPECPIAVLALEPIVKELAKRDAERAGM